MEIKSIDPRTDPLWSKLVETHRSDVFHSPRWIRVLSETYGFEAGACVLLDGGGQPQGGIPFCRIDDLKGERFVSLPFSDYCDPVVSDGVSWQYLSDWLVQWGRVFTLRCVHCPIPLTDARFSQTNRAYWHGIDLTPDIDTIWSNLDSGTRRAIKKSQHSGLVVRASAREDDLRAFFALHLRLRKYKYHLLAQPYAFFWRIWHHFIKAGQGVLMVAEQKRKMIAGVLYLKWKGGLYYKFNASDPESLSVRPNDRLLWEGIRYAKAMGCSHLDLGLSDWDQEGLVRYKRKYAGQEKTISFLRYESHNTSNGHVPQINALLPQLTGLFTSRSVSDGMTERAGEILYRFFA